MSDTKSPNDPDDTSSSDASVIERFSGDYKFLSNFQASTFFYEGKKYASVEHAYQSLKSHDPDEQEAIRNAVSAGQAKKMGRAAMMRDDWEQTKVPLMKELLRLKFQNPFLRHKLVETGDAVLVEGNTWDDNFWGVAVGRKWPQEGTKGRHGGNMLGKLLMEVRAEIKVEDSTES